MNARATLPILSLAALGAASYACGDAAPPPSPSMASIEPGAPPGRPATLDGGAAGAEAGKPALAADPPLCTTAAWSGGAKVREMSASDLQSLAGITPLGRTVAWVDTNGKLLTADRNASDVEFDEAVIVGAGSPDGRAALHPAGALLLATSASRAGLVVYERQYRKDPWVGPSTTGLDALDTQLSSLGATISEMTIGGSPGSLFLLLEIGGAWALYESPFDAQTKTWGHAVVHDESVVASAPGKIRRPTGLSWDALTLFFFDASAGVTRAAWRASAAGRFDTVVDVGAISGAIPAQSCTLLYYVDHDKDGVALFSVSR
jgi:hypothetical protein